MEVRAEVPGAAGSWLSQIDMYGHFVKSQNLQLIGNHLEPGNFPLFSLVTSKWPTCSAISAAGYSSNFRLLLPLESSFHRHLLRLNYLEPGPFLRSIAFGASKWPTCPTIKPAVLLIFVCCCRWGLAVPDKHVVLLWNVTKSSVNRKSPRTRFFQTFYRLRNCLVTHMSID